MKNYAIILASGTGTRFSTETPKQFVKIAGKTVLEHTIDLFESYPDIDEIFVVIAPPPSQYRYLAEEILLKNNYKKVSKLLNGGDTRKESSFIGISAVTDTEANLLIHDCARPFLSHRIITDCLVALQKYDAVDVAIKSTDTIIQINDHHIIENIPQRAYMWRGQTPQCFKLSTIKKAHELSVHDNDVTDDCGLILKHHLCEVFVVEGAEENIKITYPTDIFMADKLFQIKSNSVPLGSSLTELKDKVLVVFGGGHGIGACIVEQAKQVGARVFSFSLHTGCDVADYDEVSKALEEVYQSAGQIDYVVNTAGILKIGKLLDRDINDISQEIAVNYMGSINVVKASIKYLVSSHGGLLLFSSSSYTRGRALYSTYSSTKAGLVNLTQALAEELYIDGIKINIINPARTATPMRFQAFGREPEESLLKPEKVAEASLQALLSTLTGQVIDVRNN